MNQRFHDTVTGGVGENLSSRQAEGGVVITAGTARILVQHRVQKAFAGRHGHGTAKDIRYRRLDRDQLARLLALAYLDGFRDSLNARTGRGL